MSTIALIGATGNVGRHIVEMLLERKHINPQDLRLYASKKGVLHSKGASFDVREASEDEMKGQLICLFAVESDVSARLVPAALAGGAYVVDSSSFYRLDPDVPLIVPPVNQNLIQKKTKLYAHANCLASPMSTVLAPLHRKLGVTRVMAVTYQSTAGAGKAAMDECFQETASHIKDEPYERRHFKRPIAFNVIPQVGDILESGDTYEEYKIAEEVKKVVDPALWVHATAVRVPVMVGHSIALTLDFKEPIRLEDVRDILKEAPSVRLSENVYHTPREVVGTDDVHVGRVRLDPHSPSTLHLWLCSDNLRRGAATDAVEILDAIHALVR